MRTGRVFRFEVQHDPCLGMGRLGPDRLHAEGVCDQQVMRRGQRRFRLGATGRVRAHTVPVIRDDVRLVERREVADAIAEPGGDQGRELGERMRRRPFGPATGILQPLRQIPVIQRDERVDLLRQQLVDQSVVEVESGFVGPADPFGEDAGPRDREAICAQPQVGHQLDVVAVAVVVVARDVPGVVVAHPPRGVREAIPDALSTSVFTGRALDLVGRGRGAPHELGGELRFRHGASFLGALPRMTGNVHLTWPLRTLLTDPDQPLR